MGREKNRNRSRSRSRSRSREEDEKGKEEEGPEEIHEKKTREGDARVMQVLAKRWRDQSQGETVRETESGESRLAKEVTQGQEDDDEEKGPEDRAMDPEAHVRVELAVDETGKRSLAVTCQDADGDVVVGSLPWDVQGGILMPLLDAGLTPHRPFIDPL